jgi:hypothetical protein
MANNQRLAMFVMVLTALLAGPAYVIFAILTIPLGLGLLMLFGDSHWILNLYPFVFAGEMRGTVASFYLATAVSIPLTVLEWLFIAWLFGVLARDFKPRLMVLSALALVLVVGALTSVILHSAGITVVWPRLRM